MSEHKDAGMAAGDAEPEATENDGAGIGATEGPEVSGAPAHRSLSWTAIAALVLAAGALVLATRPFWSDAWLGKRSAAPVSAERVDTLADRVDSITDRVARLQRQQESADTGLRGGLDRLRDEVATVREMAGESGREGGGIDELESSLGDLVARLDRIENRLNTESGAIRARVEEFESSVAGRLETLNARLDQLDARLEAAGRARLERLRLGGIESLLTLARDRLELFGDLEAARRAWDRAAERVEMLDGARYDRLLEALRAEARALAEYRRPATDEAVERLFGLAAKAGGWPSVSDTESGAAGPAAGAGEPDSWRERLGRIVDGLVRVEQIDESVPTPAEVDRVRRRVGRMLESAALALARDERALAQSLVGRAENEVARVFDTDAEPVAEALDWMREFVSQPASAPPQLDRAIGEIAQLLERGE